MNKKRKHKFLRVCLLTVILVSFLSIAAVFGTYIWADSQIDDQKETWLYDALSIGGTSSLLSYDQDRDEYVTFRSLYIDTDRSWSNGDEIPAVLKDAFVSIEDRRFYRHDGVDWLRTAKASLNYLFKREKRFGGSTITQQVVKNVVGEGDATPKRKIKEIVRALRLEKRYSKDELLVIYLNIVPLGNRCTGVKSAARFYFSKDPGSLSLTECASLAAITNSPVGYDPLKNPERHLARRNLVLQSMFKNGYIDRETYLNSSAEPLTLDLDRTGDVTGIYDWYTETVIGEAIADLSEALSVSPRTAREMLYRGGLQIRCGIDRQAQKTAETIFNVQYDASSEPKKDNASAAMILIDPKNGEIKAIIGARGNKTANRITNGATDILRPPGSVLKPVALYAPAIEHRICHWSTLFQDIPSVGRDAADAWPHNSPDVYDGSIPLAEALARSKNTVAVQLYEMLGDRLILDTLRTLGISTLTIDRQTKDGVLTDAAPSPLALGQLTDGVSLLEMTAAYLPLANKGKTIRPHSIRSISDSKGKIIVDNHPEPTTVFSPATSSIMTKMLQGVADTGTARDLRAKQIVDVACKTGTSSSALDKWLIGYTPDYLCGVRCSSTDGHALGGGDGSALTLWDDLICSLYRDDFEDRQKEDRSSFTTPPDVIRAPYCVDSGELPQDLCLLDPRGDRTATGFYTSDNMPHETCPLHMIAWKDLLTGEISTRPGFLSHPVIVLGGTEDSRKIAFRTRDLPYFLWYNQRKTEDE